MNAVTGGTADRIRNAAVELFRDRGYSATTTRDIAARAGITVGSLYNHFESKQALLFDVLLSAHQEALDLLGELLDERLSPSEALRVAARGHARFHAEHPAAITVVYKDIAFLSPEQYQRIVQLRHQYENIVIGIIQAGLEQGAFRVDDAPLAAIAILSMGIRISAWFKPGGRLTADQIAEHYAEFALRMVGCTTDTRPDSSNGHDAAQVLGRAPGPVEAPGLPPES